MTNFRRPSDAIVMAIGPKATRGAPVGSGRFLLHAPAMTYQRLASIMVFLGAGVVGCGDNAANPGQDGSAKADLSNAIDAAGGSGDMANRNGDDLTMSAGDLAMADLAPPPKPDMSKAPCGPSGNCKGGPACGNTCCASGEFCDMTNAQPTCKCGLGNACTNGDHCASAGAMGIDQCGTICCGVSGPCPL
jgi:hypothetical protein